jgi:hydroxypyruvate reductase
MHPRFLTRSLAMHPFGARVTRMLADALAAVDPAQAVARSLVREGARLRVAGDALPLAGFGQIFLLGAGKAAAPMAHAAAGILGERLTRGLAITKEGHASPVHPRVTLLEASHPIPDARGIAATRQLMELAASAAAGDLVICVISGGGSALLTAPAPGVSLDGLRRMTDGFLASGASVHEINIVRKHFSQIKGGQLARLVHPAALITLILSDEVHDDLATIASGPTVPDPSTAAEARQVLAKYGVAAPGEPVETPKPGEAVFAGVRNVLVGTNRLAAEAAAQSWGAGAGARARVVQVDLEGEAREAGRWLAAQAGAVPAGGCWIFGGETTVTLGAARGLGGRNQEMALAAVRGLAGLEGALFVTLATDGGDGPTDAAGAVVTGETLARAEARGLDPDDFLARHDAYHFFSELGDLLQPGATRTNVNDLAFLIRQ